MENSVWLWSKLKISTMNYAEFKAILETNPQMRTTFLIYARCFNGGSVGFDFCAPKFVNDTLDYSEVVNVMQRAIDSENDEFEAMMTKYHSRVQTDPRTIRNVINSLPLPISEEIPAPWEMKERLEE